jgi:hypothetical protein
MLASRIYPLDSRVEAITASLAGPPVGQLINDSAYMPEKVPGEKSIWKSSLLRKGICISSSSSVSKTSVILSPLFI